MFNLFNTEVAKCKFRHRYLFVGYFMSLERIAAYLLGKLLIYYKFLNDKICICIDASLLEYPYSLFIYFEGIIT